MKKGRFTEEQIIGILKQHEAERKVPELAREKGHCERRFIHFDLSGNCVTASERALLRQARCIRYLRV